MTEVGFKSGGAGSRDHILTQDAPGEKPSVTLKLTVREEVGWGRAGCLSQGSPQGR